MSQRSDAPSPSPASIIVASGFVSLVVAAGYVYLGTGVAVIFLLGYGSGLLFWLTSTHAAPFASVRGPYWLAFAAFVLHKVEENRTQFFEVLAREVTGVPVPSVSATLMITLLIIPLGAWLLVPALMKRYALGTFLAWTFFASMAISEAAHFVFPVLSKSTYGYFPGMATATLLVPLGIWGLTRLHRQSRKPSG